ncbi:MliC family protein [Pseudostreptobacillus sp.]
MKKLILIATAIVALSSCSSANSNNVTTFENQKTAVLNAKDQYVFNLEGSDTRILLVVTPGNDAYVKYNGKEIMFKRVVTASGEAFESKENKMYIGIKGKEAFLELNDTTNIPLKVVGNSKEYGEAKNEYVYNFKGVDNNMNMNVVYDRVKDLVNVKIDNSNVTLNRIRSASGMAFSNENGNIYLGIKGNQAYVEVNGQGFNFVESNIDYSEYAKEQKTRVYSFKNGNNEVNLALVGDGDVAGLRFEGRDYVLNRIKSASGEAFESRDGKVYFGVKNYGDRAEGYLEINGKSYSFDNGKYIEK